MPGLCLEGFVRKALLGSGSERKRRNRRAASPIVDFAAALHEKEMRMIRNRTCPFCGRKFSSLHGIRVHLSLGNGSCRVGFSELVADTVELFRECRSKIRKNYYGGGKARSLYWFEEPIDGMSVSASRIADLLAFLAGRINKMRLRKL